MRRLQTSKHPALTTGEADAWLEKKPESMHWFLMSSLRCCASRVVRKLLLEPSWCYNIQRRRWRNIASVQIASFNQPSRPSTTVNQNSNHAGIVIWRSHIWSGTSLLVPPNFSADGISASVVQVTQLLIITYAWQTPENGHLGSELNSLSRFELDCATRSRICGAI